MSSVTLRVIAKRHIEDAEKTKTMEEEELISTAFTYFSNFHSAIVDLGTATAMVQTLVAIAALPQHEDFSGSMSECIWCALGNLTVTYAFTLFRNEIRKSVLDNYHLYH